MDTLLLWGNTVTKKECWLAILGFVFLGLVGSLCGCLGPADAVEFIPEVLVEGRVLDAGGRGMADAEVKVARSTTALDLPAEESASWVRLRTGPEGHFTHTFAPTSRRYSGAIIMGIVVSRRDKFTRAAFCLLARVDQRTYGVGLSKRKPEVLLVADSGEGKRPVGDARATEEVSASMEHVGRNKDVLNITIMRR
jgi:hypothetical protein